MAPFELADVAAPVFGGPEDAGDEEVVDLLVVSDGVGEVAVQEYRAIRERAHLCCCGRAQGWVERSARPREEERVEVVQEPGRRYLRVGDKRVATMPGASLSSSSLALLPSTATSCHLRREDRGAVVTGIAREDPQLAPQRR